jgi:hypothetical protein
MTSCEPTVLSDVEAHRLFLNVMESARKSLSLLHKLLSRETEIILTISSKNVFRHHVKLAAQLAEWRELRSWFLGPDCLDYCEMLQLDPAKVRESVAPYSNLPYNARTFASMLDTAIRAAEDRFGPASEVGANA